jgi:F-type H+-transporting ATPase subunit epsilon
MSLHVKLITPDRTLLDEEVVSVSLPTPDGEITILTHHVPIASLVSPGIVKLKRVTRTEEFAVGGGFVRVNKEGLIEILTYTAEQADELDLSVIIEAKERAARVMSEAARQDDVSFAQAAAGLERELARYRVAIKHRGAKHTPTMDRPNLPHDENPT